MPVPEQVLASTRTVPEPTRSNTAGKSPLGAVVVPIVGASVGPSTVGSTPDGSVVGALLLVGPAGSVGGAAEVLPDWACPVGSSARFTSTTPATAPQTTAMAKAMAATTRPLNVMIDSVPELGP